MNSFMLFRTIVDVAPAPFSIKPSSRMLLVGSCFAGYIGERFRQERFVAEVNPFGVMYNPVSVLHTIERLAAEDRLQADVAVLTLGTNHVYRLKETGEIVDNCQKRPQRLFEEEQLSVEQCADALRRAVALLRQANPEVAIVLTVSPIRYRKYGYHGSQLSKATLLLAVEEVLLEGQTYFEGQGASGRGQEDSAERLSASSISADKNYSPAPCSLSLAPQQTPPVPQALSSCPLPPAPCPEQKVPCPPIYYFPAYEIVNDELRDYRFYASDMLHPSEQAVDYIWERFQEACFSSEAREYMEQLRPVKEALAHRPFNPQSPEYQAFMERTRKKAEVLRLRYPHLNLFTDPPPAPPQGRGG